MVMKWVWVSFIFHVSLTRSQISKVTKLCGSWKKSSTMCLLSEGQSSFHSVTLCKRKPVGYVFQNYYGVHSDCTVMYVCMWVCVLSLLRLFSLKLYTQGKLWMGSINLCQLNECTRMNLSHQQGSPHFLILLLLDSKGH